MSEEQQQGKKKFMFLSPERIERLKRMPLKYKILIASQCIFAIGLTKYAQYLLTKEQTDTVKDNNKEDVLLSSNPILHRRQQRANDKYDKFEQNQKRRSDY